MYVWASHINFVAKKIECIRIQNVCGQSIFISHSTLYAPKLFESNELIGRFNNE